MLLESLINDAKKPSTVPYKSKPVPNPTFMKSIPALGPVEGHYYQTQIVFVNEIPLQPMQGIMPRTSCFKRSNTVREALVLMLRLLMYAAREMIYAPIWASFLPNEVSSVQSSWRRAAVQYPLIFHAEAANSLNWLMLKHARSNSFRRELGVRQLQHRGIALQILRKDVEVHCSIPSLFHAHAIGLLAWANGATSDYTEPYPQSPMADLGSVYIISRCKPTPAHIQAYYQIVLLNKGCNQEEVALAQTNEL